MVHRFLPAGSFEGILDAIEERVRQVFQTPVAAWDSPEWFTAAVMLFVGLWCCGCICQQRRRPYYGRGYGGNGYYPNQQPGLMTGGGGGGAGGGNCLRNVVMCACCYELCCRDCQDLQSILPAGMLQKLPNEDYAIHNDDKMERGGAVGPTVAIV